jgi:glycosyltransferase involved in cell wall biosynthesis
MPDETVAVVVPVHNAARYVDQALLSALNQTYPATEVIVVDDGSTDNSLQIATERSRRDSRIRVLRQSQRGPGAARNLAISEAKSDLIAPLDADDLWHPTKLQRQIEMLRQAGARVGLVYTWFARIDGMGNIRSTGHRPMASGEVFRDCCQSNIVGNGSGALMRKSAILECGGYDESLPGCEDYKLYAAIAERYLFALVPEHLTGYRQTNENLTSDVGMMLRSSDIVLADLQQRHPEMFLQIREHRLELCHWLLRRGLMARDFSAALGVFRAMWKIDRSFALGSLAALPKDLTVFDRGVSRRPHRSRQAFLSDP